MVNLNEQKNGELIASQN
jgi:CRP-like cAMP-binding protein